MASKDFSVKSLDFEKKTVAGTFYYAPTMRRPCGC